MKRFDLFASTDHGDNWRYLGSYHAVTFHDMLSRITLIEQITGLSHLRS